MGALGLPCERLDLLDTDGGQSTKIDASPDVPLRPFSSSRELEGAVVEFKGNKTNDDRVVELSREQQATARVEGCD